MTESRPGKPVKKDIPFDRERYKASFEARLGRFSEEGRAQIMEVYVYSQDAHGNQRRDEGPIFWTHPVESATNYIRAGGKAVNIVCMILLHDVREDTKKDVSAKDFGAEVAEGVAVLTKPKIKDVKPHTKKEVRRIAYENLRFSTWEVIVAKLSERLHNIRTLFPLREERQLATLEATREILLPIFESAVNVSSEPEVVRKLIQQLKEAMDKAEEALAKKGRGRVVK